MGYSMYYSKVFVYAFTAFTGPAITCSSGLEGEGCLFVKVKACVLNVPDYFFSNDLCFATNNLLLFLNS